MLKSSIAWSEELEIDADAIYLEIQQKSPEEIFHSPMTHATY